MPTIFDTFTLFTDHKPLTHCLLRVSPPWCAQQQRQLSFLSEFTSNLIHLPGSQNLVADALSQPSPSYPLASPLFPVSAIQPLPPVPPIHFFSPPCSPPTILFVWSPSPLEPLLSSVTSPLDLRVIWFQLSSARGFLMLFTTSLTLAFFPPQGWS